MSDARVEGNVYYKLIEMAMGAEVNGQMVHKEEKQKLLGHHKKGENKADADESPKSKGDKSKVLNEEEINVS